MSDQKRTPDSVGDSRPGGDSGTQGDKYGDLQWRCRCEATPGDPNKNLHDNFTRSCMVCLMARPRSSDTKCAFCAQQIVPASNAYSLISDSSGHVFCSKTCGHAWLTGEVRTNVAPVMMPAPLPRACHCGNSVGGVRWCPECGGARIGLGPTDETRADKASCTHCGNSIVDQEKK